MNKRLTRTLLIGFLLISVMPFANIARAQEQITLTYWDWWVTQAPAIDAAIEAFEAANPNINIEKTTQGGGTFDNLFNTAMQSATGPDVFLVDNAARLLEYINAGWVQPLSDFEDFEEWKATFPDPEIAFAEGVNVVDGKAYSAPFGAPLPWLQMYVNTKVYRDAGLVNEDGSLKLPNTVEEMLENSRVIKEATGKYGFGFSSTQSWAAGWWWWLCQRSGPLFVGPNGGGFNLTTGKYEWATSECPAQAVEYLMTLKSEDLILPDTVNFAIDDEGARAKFAEGEFAHLIGGTWIINGWQQTHPDFEDFTIIRMPIVVGEEASSYWGIAPGGTQFAINAATQHPEEAWEFIKFLYSEEFGRIWTETGNGLSLFTPGSPDDYELSDAWKNYFTQTDVMIAEPALGVMNPDVAKVQATLTGPTADDVLLGIFSGQITDVPAALADLDQRLQTALEQGISDAAAAGASVSIEDYILEDYDPMQPYETGSSGN
jgi:ABC-type glycerol-3-phosphate transport system substrate-binding protein